MVIAGDFNVIPAPEDVYNPTVDGRRAVPPRDPRPFPGAHQSWANGRLSHACHDEPHRYTFWDYQAGAYQKNQGLRIDHLLLSPQAADRGSIMRDRRFPEKLGALRPFQSRLNSRSSGP